jgi:hypothetical protein
MKFQNGNQDLYSMKLPGQQCRNRMTWDTSTPTLTTQDILKKLKQFTLSELPILPM